MDATLSLVQINIERSKHVGLVLPFLLRQHPDVICMQELMEEDLEHFKRELGMEAVYAPMAVHPRPESVPGVVGLAVFSRLPLSLSRTTYYHKSTDPLPQHTPGLPDSIANALIRFDVEKGGVLYRLATTHFTWAAEGGVNDLQRVNLQKLFALLEREGELVLTGDFNAPRGGEIFSAIAARYKDNIPPEYTTSIDGSLHRAGPMEYMVDCIFSTPGYTVSDVKLVSGVSDHCAVVATVSKA